jgi:hypothetical protein
MLSGIGIDIYFLCLLFLSGQILNRFSKDMGSIDEILPQTLVDCVQVRRFSLF